MVYYVFLYGMHNAFRTVIMTRACTLLYTLLGEVIMHSTGPWTVFSLESPNQQWMIMCNNQPTTAVYHFGPVRPTPQPCSVISLHPLMTL